MRPEKAPIRVRHGRWQRTHRDANSGLCDSPDRHDGASAAIATMAVTSAPSTRLERRRRGDDGGGGSGGRRQRSATLATGATSHDHRGGARRFLFRCLAPCALVAAATAVVPAAARASFPTVVAGTLPRSRRTPRHTAQPRTATEAGETRRQACAAHAHGPEKSMRTGSNPDCPRVRFRALLLISDRCWSGSFRMFLAFPTSFLHHSQQLLISTISALVRASFKIIKKTAFGCGDVPRSHFLSLEVRL